MITWNGGAFEVRHVELVSFCPAETGRRSRASSEWLHAVAIAEGDDDRSYSFEVATLAWYFNVALLHPRSLASDESWSPLGEVGRGTEYGQFYINPARPIVLVSCTSFADDVFWPLQGSPGTARAQFMVPLLTEAEQRWLDDVHQRDVSELIPRAHRALQKTFGTDFRIEADSAEVATEVLRSIGFVLPADELFTAIPGSFSEAARSIIRAVLDARPEI